MVSVAAVGRLGYGLQLREKQKVKRILRLYSKSSSADYFKRAERA